MAILGCPWLAVRAEGLGDSAVPVPAARVTPGAQTNRSTGGVAAVPRVLKEGQPGAAGAIWLGPPAALLTHSCSHSKLARLTGLSASGCLPVTALPS